MKRKEHLFGSSRHSKAKAISQIRLILKASFVSLIIICFSGFSSGLGDDGPTIMVKVSFNGADQDIETKVNWHEGISALEALQKVATVETHAIKQHVIVNAINNVENIRGSKAWYYKVNGQAANKLAISYTPVVGDVIEWQYATDTCSVKVDKKSLLTE